MIWPDDNTQLMYSGNIINDIDFLTWDNLVYREGVRILPSIPILVKAASYPYYKGEKGIYIDDYLEILDL